MREGFSSCEGDKKNRVGLGELFCIISLLLLAYSISVIIITSYRVISISRLLIHEVNQPACIRG
jgi:hypothetical protein